MVGRNQLVIGGLATRGTLDSQLKMRDLQEGVVEGEKEKKWKKVCVCPKERKKTKHEQKEPKLKDERIKKK